MLYHTSELHHDLWKKENKRRTISNYSSYEEKGKTVYMSEREHTHQTTPKIIINGFGVKYIYFDEKGEYGTTDTPFILLTADRNIYKMLSTNLWNFIVNAIGILGNNLNERIFFYIPNILNIIKAKKIKRDIILSESEIFNLLELSENDQNKLKNLQTIMFRM